jgi:transposase
MSNSTPKRFVGLDIHKQHFTAVGVDRDRNQIFGPKKVSVRQLETWRDKHLNKGDAVVLEMTTNTYLFHDLLKPYVHSVIVVHPPHVALVTRVRVKTDYKAALTLAQLHAVGMLTPIWVPPVEVRELRSMIAQRTKMVSLATQAKNRLHAVLHREHVSFPEEGSPFSPEQRAWWESLPLSKREAFRIQSDLDTLAFAKRQILRIEDFLAEEAAQDERVPVLVQLPGVGLLTAMTILAAVGTIERFESAKKLVGYAGLGAAVYDSGQKRTTGRITKMGRRDLRGAMIDAAHIAIRHHPKWKAEFERLEHNIGRNKAIVAVARKLLVVVWHVLTKDEADKHADPEKVAGSLLNHVYHRIGIKNLPEGMTAKLYVRHHMDKLGIGKDLTHIQWGSKRIPLPPSSLKETG